MIQYDKPNDIWNARHNNILQCPVPGCNHVGEIITKAHLKTHGLTREECKALYGMPIIKNHKEGFRTSCNVDKWNSVSNSSSFVYRSSFMNLYRKQ